MHLYILARGINDELKRWEADMSAQFLPVEYEKGVWGNVRLAFRPVQLYEVVFPAPQLENVLNLINPSIDEYGGKYRFHLQMIKWFRKILGLKPIPEWNKKLTVMNSIHPWVGVHGIGIKEDEYLDGIERL